MSSSQRILFSELSAAVCGTVRHVQAELLLGVWSEGAFQMVTDVSGGEFETSRQGQWTCIKSRRPFVRILLNQWRA